MKNFKKFIAVALAVFVSVFMLAVSAFASDTDSLVRMDDGTWNYMENGEHNTDYTGLVKYYETIFNLAVRNNNLYDMLSASLYENKNSLRERMEHVMKSYNVKKRPMAVAAAILTLFVAMSSVMVAGAATTVTETSVKVAEVTADEKRELQVLETEYYDPLIVSSNTCESLPLAIIYLFEPSGCIIPALIL